MELFDSSLDSAKSWFTNGYMDNQIKLGNTESQASFPRNAHFGLCDFFTLSRNGGYIIYGNKTLTIFDLNENSGTSQSCRCVKCSYCSDCKNGFEIDDMSIKEEIEQDFINKNLM